MERVAEGWCSQIVHVHSQKTEVPAVVARSTCYAAGRAVEDTVCCYGMQRRSRTAHDHSVGEGCTWEAAAVETEAAASCCMVRLMVEVDEVEAAHTDSGS